MSMCSLDQSNDCDIIWWYDIPMLCYYITWLLWCWKFMFIAILFAVNRIRHFDASTICYGFMIQAVINRVEIVGRVCLSPSQLWKFKTSLCAQAIARILQAAYLNVIRQHLRHDSMADALYVFTVTYFLYNMLHFFPINKTKAFVQTGTRRLPHINSTQCKFSS